MSSNSPPLAPVASQTVHIVLDDLGSRFGRVYCETGEAEADEASTVGNILDGLYERPLQVIAFNASAGWARDVTADIALAVLKRAQMEHRLMAVIAQGFVIRALGPGAIAYRVPASCSRTEWR
jgi:hypothetical protein